MIAGKTIYVKMIGIQFGMLFVTDIVAVTNDSNKRTIYEAICQCDCGNVHKCLASSIKAGRTASCGCRRDQYQKTTGKNSVQFTGYEEISGKMYSNMKWKASKRGLIFDISIEYLWDLFIQQNKKCALSNIDLVFSNKTSINTASLDRIDSKLSYLHKNVQWVHKRINMMKNVLSQTEFIYYCTKIGKHNA